jgi:hypothetical protein
MTNPSHLAVQAAELYPELIKFMKGYSETYDDRVHATWLIQQTLTQAFNAGVEASAEYIENEFVPGSCTANKYKRGIRTLLIQSDGGMP